MNAREFFRKYGSLRLAAKKIGYTETYLCMVLSGKRKPSKFCAQAISDYTNGVVSADQFFKVKP